MGSRNAIVTGANRGLGLVASTKLAKLGYSVRIACRSLEQGNRAAEKIRAHVPGAQVKAEALDLASFESIHRFADGFHKQGQPLHLLINNAGVLGLDQRLSHTKEGLESTFGVNHMGHFLLTHLLLPDLRKAAPSRIVVVASQMHRPEVGEGPWEEFDFDNLRGEKSFHPVVAYRQSKLANLWFTYELARQLEGSGVTVNAVCPNFVPETVAENQTSLFKKLLFRYVLPRFPFARTAEQGAGNTVYAATEPALEGISGKFFTDRQIISSNEESYDRKKSMRLWEESCRMCGVEKFGVPSEKPAQAEALD